MSASATTRQYRSAFVQERRHMLGTGAVWLHERARSMGCRVAAALRAQRRSQRARSAAHEAYAALHRLDDRLLRDIGIHRDQLTPFVQAATARRARPDVDTRGED